MSVARKSLVDGVAIVDKPKGPTSHDVVARVRRALKTRHAGHAGTLDPMASGVLVIAVGEATKLVPYLTADDKAYVATVRLGVATDTLDAEGNETERVAVPAAVREAVAGLTGAAVLEHGLAVERSRTMQVPPAFSAIRIDGERSHELARRGEPKELAPRAVAVRRLEVVGGRVDGDIVEVMLAVDVSKGYFVRSLARDLAAALGTVGHLTALRRTRSGAFALADAVAVEALTNEALMSVTAAASRALPVSILDEVGLRAVSFGQRVPAESMRDPHRAPSAWLDEAGALVAIGEVTDDGTGRVLRGFSDGQPRLTK